MKKSGKKILKYKKGGHVYKERMGKVKLN